MTKLSTQGSPVLEVLPNPVMLTSILYREFEPYSVPRAG